MCRPLFPVIYFLTSVFYLFLSASRLKGAFLTLFFNFSTMSQSTTSDLVSTIATQLNIVIVALRLLVDMIQNPDATCGHDLGLLPLQTTCQSGIATVSNRHETIYQLGTL